MKAATTLIAWDDAEKTNLEPPFPNTVLKDGRTDRTGQDIS